SRLSVDRPARRRLRHALPLGGEKDRQQATVARRLTANKRRVNYWAIRLDCPTHAALHVRPWDPHGAGSNTANKLAHAWAGVRLSRFTHPEPRAQSALAGASTMRFLLSRPRGRRCRVPTLALLEGR